MAESLGCWHTTAVAEFKRIVFNLARHTCRAVGQAFGHLMSRMSILLQRGLASIPVHRISCRPAHEDTGLL